MAKGINSRAKGIPSKVKGNNSKVKGIPSRAKGNNSRAKGIPSRAKGIPSGTRLDHSMAGLEQRAGNEGQDLEGGCG